jgi:hypothetical protein
MKIACLTPTYGRPRLVANAVACFEAQDHRAADRRLLILDDAAQISGEGPTWRIWSTAGRYGSLPEKYAALMGLLAAWWPEWEAVAIQDDDDIYGPQWLSSHAEALRSAAWSQPSRIWSLFGWDGQGLPALEPTAGRFWASAAVRRDLLERVGGFIQTPRADFDQRNLWAWKDAGGDPGRPDRDQPPQYVYGWGRSNHCSGLMGSSDWYQRHPMMDRSEGGEVFPAFDLLTRILHARLWGKPAEAISEAGSGTVCPSDSWSQGKSEAEHS